MSAGCDEYLYLTIADAGGGETLGNYSGHRGYRCFASHIVGDDQVFVARFAETLERWRPDRPVEGGPEGGFDRQRSRHVDRGHDARDIKSG